MSLTKNIAALVLNMLQFKKHSLRTCSMEVCFHNICSDSHSYLFPTERSFNTFKRMTILQFNSSFVFSLNSKLQFMKRNLTPIVFYRQNVMAIIHMFIWSTAVTSNIQINCTVERTGNEWQQCSFWNQTRMESFRGVHRKPKFTRNCVEKEVRLCRPCHRVQCLLVGFGGPYNY